MVEYQHYDLGSCTSVGSRTYGRNSHGSMMHFSQILALLQHLENTSHILCDYWSGFEPGRNNSSCYNCWANFVICTATENCLPLPTSGLSYYLINNVLPRCWVHLPKFTSTISWPQAVLALACPILWHQEHLFLKYHKHPLLWHRKEPIPGLRFCPCISMNGLLLIWEPCMRLPN